MPTQVNEKLGALDCTTVLTPGEQFPSLAVLLCHGFGASGTDLVPCASELLSLVQSPAEEIVFVFPAAPIKLSEMGSYDSRAWWPIDMEELSRMIESGEERNLRDEAPPEMPPALDMLHSTIEAIKERYRLNNNQLLLGGFSQGAMLTTEYSLSMESPPAGLCIFSGNLLNEPRIDELLATQAPIKIFQSHGKMDPILPFSGAEALRDKLLAANHLVEFCPFMGVHTIPMESIRAMAAMIDDAIAKPPN